LRTRVINGNQLIAMISPGGWFLDRVECSKFDWDESFDSDWWVPKHIDWIII
jgi:hypothetical protein